MNYKKLVSLFAVSILALSACGTTDDTKGTTDEAEETTEVEKNSSSDLMDRAQESTGDAFPEYGLYVPGAWSAEGRIVQHTIGEEAVIPVDITSEHAEYNVYLVENGVITEVVSNEPEVNLTVETPSADTDYLVGVSADVVGETGDEVAEEDFYRAEKVIFEAVEPTTETEE